MYNIPIDEQNYATLCMIDSEELFCELLSKKEINAIRHLRKQTDKIYTGEFPLP